MPRPLSPQQIDAAIAALYAKEGEWISRGRGGDGFAQRGGQLFTISVEESAHDERPISEAALRTLLAHIDLDDYSDRYRIWALQQLGVELAGPGFPSPR
jgi:hypothetical protein